MGKIYYRIAQLDIKLELKNLNPIYLFNFTPFRVEDESVSTLLFSITQGKIKEIRCNPTREYIVDQFIISIYLLKNECYLKVHSGLTKKNYFFQTDYQWSDIKTDLLFNELEEYAVLNHVITFFFIYSSSFYDTVFFNASSICFGTDAVAFLGEKGVGKSTHADLWVNHIEGSKLLNDDQPAIRIINNTIYIYGTPWGGKK